MSALGWMLLAHLIGAEAWGRVALGAGASSVTTLVLLALIAALMLALPHAGERMASVPLVLRVRADAAPAPAAPAPLPTPRSSLVPSGGRGPRAPAGRPRRPWSSAAAA
jgi:hypothetical protein